MSGVIAVKNLQQVLKHTAFLQLHNALYQHKDPKGLFMRLKLIQIFFELF